MVADLEADSSSSFRDIQKSPSQTAAAENIYDNKHIRKKYISFNLFWWNNV